jgi:hypothetical protein
MSFQRPSIGYGMRVVLGMVSLLLLASPIWASPLQQGCATMGLSPTTASAPPGGVVVLQIPLDADGVTFDVVGFLIHFDPTHLRVVDAAGDPASQVEQGDLPGTNVVNTASNTQGTIEFAQAIFGGHTGGTFTVATICLQVIGQLPVGGTQVRFVNGVGNTGVYLAGQQLLCEFPGPATITGWFTLSMNQAGSGAVTSDPVGIFCGADCTEDYVEGTLVTLSAHPGINSYLVGWSGDCVSTGAFTAQVIMYSDKSCTATFGHPVGGIAVPVDKLGLVALRPFDLAQDLLSSGQAPWMGWITLAGLAALGVALTRRRRG